jgi:hypothetical protein
MTLLDLYVGAVRTHLPKGSNKRDILTELRGHLESNMDERAAELGRSLTESEQEAVLAEFGDPFTVATRYGKAGPSFALGPFQLISPAAFPVYIGVLISILALNVIIGSVVTVLTGASFMSFVRQIAQTMLVLFLVVTLAYAGVDFFLRRSGKRQRGAPESWLFWTPYLKYMPRWYSASGLAVFSVVALAWGLWWSVWPQVPVLLLGPAAAALALSPEWQRFQLFLLGLLLLSAGQRAFSLWRPELNWVPWFVRLGINVLCVSLLYPILDSAPLIVVRDVVAASAETVALARRIDTATRGFIRGFGFYWVLNALWLALLCAWHIRYSLDHRRRRARGEPKAFGGVIR